MKLVEEKILRQHYYDACNNVPQGILTEAQVNTGRHAIRRGTVSALSALNRYDCLETVRIATDLLEDSNCHAEAKALLRAANKNGTA